MKILGIESSCDETAVAIVEDGHNVLKNMVSSQIAKHAEYGGVIPELAAREHLKSIKQITEQALKEAELTLDDIDAIAVTQLPGLIPALLVGINYAKGLAAASNKRLIPVNHITAHIFGAFIENKEMLKDPETYPILALVVSGGHTNLVLIDETGKVTAVGHTLDDAAGEAFDKAAKILDLPYPGGPVIDRIAKTGNPEAIKFPRPLCPSPGNAVKPQNKFHFSFSGLKTALLYQVKDPSKEKVFEQKVDISDEEMADLLASFQDAIVDTLVIKTRIAAEAYNAKTIVLCGGVACNSRLRTKMTDMVELENYKLAIAPPKYCTDNAAMIAGMAYYQNDQSDDNFMGMDARARLQGITQVSFT